MSRKYKICQHSSGLEQEQELTLCYSLLEFDVKENMIGVKDFQILTDFQEKMCIIDGSLLATIYCCILGERK